MKMKAMGALLALALVLSGCGSGGDAVELEPVRGSTAYTLERLDASGDHTVAVFTGGEDFYTLEMEFGGVYSLVKNGEESLYKTESGILLACVGSGGIWLLGDDALKFVTMDGENRLSLSPDGLGPAEGFVGMFCIGELLYIQEKETLHVFDGTGERLESRELEPGARAVAGADGVVYVVSETGEKLEITGLDGGAVFRLDLPGCTLFTGAGEYPLLCLYDSGLCGLVPSGELVELVDWGGGGFRIRNPKAAAATEDGRLLLLDSLGTGIFTEGAAEQDGGILTLKLGTVGDSMYDLTDAFNGENGSVRVSEIDYTLNGTLGIQDALTKLAADIASGEGPDMLLLTNLPVHSYIRRGCLLELSGLLDTESIVMADVLRVSGGLYYVSRGFGVETYAGLASNFGEAEGWTMESFLEAEAKLAPGSKMFYNASRELFLRMTCPGYLQKAIDWENGSCDFDNAEFKTLLDTAAHMTESPEEAGSSYVPPSQLLRSGAEYVSVCYVGSVTRMSAFETEVGEKLCFVGMPAPDGENGSMVYTNRAVCVMASTKHPEACVSFLNYILTGYDPGEQDYELNSSLPLYRPYLDNMVERARADGKLSGEDEERFFSFLDCVKYSSLCDEEVMDIILEEAGAVFSGIRNADEAAKIVQDRVSIYVAEQS